MKLSIGMMVKNEEKHLEQCLCSLTPILDRIDSELIIVDTGSNDRTIEIAKKFTDKVYFHKWNNNFAEMRNITLSYCSGDWFFYIDGDEVIEDCKGIIDFFNSGEYKNYKSATYNIKNLTDLNDENNYSVFPALRIFKKDKDFKFTGAIHNQPAFKKPIKALNVWIKHFGYISTDKELMEKKFKRTSEILKNELIKDPGNIYYMYQLSVSYGMHYDNENAVTEIEKAYAYIKENEINISEYICVLQQLCSSYLNTNNYFQVIKYASEWLIYDNNSIDAHFFLGYSYFMLSKNEKALNYMEKYVEIIENNKYSMNDTGVITYYMGKIDDAYYCLSLLYRKINETEKAMYYLLKIKNSKRNITQEIVSFCINNRYFNGLYKYYNNLLEAKDKNEIDKFFLYIEGEKLRLDKNECKEITELFAKGNNLYNKLNCLRISYENSDDNFISDLNKFLDKENLVNLPDYYGDLIFYLIDLKENIYTKLRDISYKVLNNYLVYMSTKYDNFSDKVYEYLKVYGVKEDFDSLKINKELFRYIILLNKLDNEKFKYIFLNYIDIGIKYINIVYTPFILENEMYQECRTIEEGFFILISIAMKYEKSNKKLYLQYLSKAVMFYPNMKDGIKLLLEEVKQNQNKDNEIEEYKKKVKKSISEFIELNNIDKAKILIHEYEDIIKDDPEIYSMKAVIAIEEKNYIEAEKILKDGLLIDSNNFDLIYNLGYLYENINEYELSLEYYKKAINVVENEKVKSEIDLAINTILNKLNLYSEKNVENDSNVINYIKLNEYNKLFSYLMDLLKQMKFKYVLNVCDYIIINIKVSIPPIYLLKGIAYNGLKDYQSAEKYHRIAIRLDKYLCDIAGKGGECDIKYEENTTPCIGCGGKDYSIVNVSNQSLSESNKGIINPIRVWARCEECGLIYSNPIPSEDAMNRYYSRIAKEKFGGIYGNIKDREGFLLSMANDRLNKISSYITNAKILDIGTGIGVFVKAAIDRGIEAYGLELTPEDCEYAKTNYGLDLIRKNFYDFDKEHLYDVVTMFEVIEHLRHPQKDLIRVNKIIKQNGILVIATPILDSNYGRESKSNNVFWNVVSHLSYFTKNVMEKYLKNAGFEIIDIKDSLEGMGRMEFYCKKTMEVK